MRGKFQSAAAPAAAAAAVAAAAAAATVADAAAALSYFVADAAVSQKAPRPRCCQGREPNCRTRLLHLAPRRTF